MGRAGRYTLSVMAWVAAYAGWSSVIGLVVAALTGDRPREVSPGVSALLTVIGPLVPTLVALWFNDWARDGFPSREQQRAAKAAPAAPAEPAAPEPEPTPEPEPVRPEVTAAPQQPATVTAHPLGVPTANGPSSAPQGAFPVAPLLRD
jgi:hypothetical protein